MPMKASGSPSDVPTPQVGSDDDVLHDRLRVEVARRECVLRRLRDGAVHGDRVRVVALPRPPQRVTNVRSGAATASGSTSFPTQMRGCSSGASSMRRTGVTDPFGANTSVETASPAAPASHAHVAGNAGPVPGFLPNALAPSSALFARSTQVTW